MNARSLIYVIVGATVAAVIAVAVTKMFGVETSSAIGGGVGGGVGGAVAGVIAAKQSGSKK